MCYAKPGPRCAGHIKPELKAALEALKADQSLENLEAYRELERDFDGTKTGQKQLQEKITAAYEDGDILKGAILQDQLVTSRRRYEQKQRDYAEFQEKAVVQYKKDATLHGNPSTQQQLAIQLAEDGGMVETETLFDLEGNYVPARIAYRENPYSNSGEKEKFWVIPQDDEDKEKPLFFSPSKAQNPEVAKKNNAKKGYYVGRARIPGKVGTVSETGTGAYIYAIVPAGDRAKWDDPEVVDNGIQETSEQTA